MGAREALSRAGEAFDSFIPCAVCRLVMSSFVIDMTREVHAYASELCMQPDEHDAPSNHCSNAFMSFIPALTFIRGSGLSDSSVHANSRGIGERSAQQARSQWKGDGHGQVNKGFSYLECDRSNCDVDFGGRCGRRIG